MVNNQGDFDSQTGSYHPDKGQQATSGKYNYAGFNPDQIKGFGKIMNHSMAIKLAISKYHLIGRPHRNYKYIQMCILIQF